MTKSIKLTPLELIRAVLFISLAIFFQPGHSNAQGALEQINPLSKVNDIINEMEHTVSRLIQQFGDTLDRQTLLALQRAVAGLQSAKFASEDVLNDTIFSSLSQERKAVINDARMLFFELESSLEDNANELSHVEQRFSKTLEDVARVSGEPWILSYGPPIFEPAREGDIRISLEGKNLDHPLNRLMLQDRELRAVSAISNRIDFMVPRKMLTADSNGFSSFRVRLHYEKNGILPWLMSWLGEQTAAREFSLDIRSAGPKLGTYKLETIVSKPDVWRLEREVFDFSNVNRVQRRHCIAPPDGGVFDPSYTEMEIIENSLSVVIVSSSKSGSSLGSGSTSRNSNASIIPGPNDAMMLDTNAPERICVTMNSPSPSDRPGWLLFNYDGLREVLLKFAIKYRARTPVPAEPWFSEGEIEWGLDVSEVLPEGSNGFRVTVDFETSAEGTRVFTSPDRYRPISVFFDSNSRSLTLRPRPVE